MNSQLGDKDRRVIKELAVLLRSSVDKILSGESKLCLTTVSLTLLNAGFQDVYQGDSQNSFEVVTHNLPGQLTLDDLFFLYDVVQKTLSLKIIHTSTTLQGRVSISDFRYLRTLEIKKVPIHLLQGFQKIRAKLHTVICSRSLNHLQDLFESCGGDMSAAMSWSELRVAILSFNFLQHLDSSLRLLPKLEVIDLSHNSLLSTESHLEYLTDIIHVNLCFNLLEALPTFSISSRLKLKTLLLRGNNLDTLAGLEALSSLEELDLSFNSLAEHGQLQPLCTLTQLRWLSLGENPLSFHENHRLLTIQYISDIAAPKLELDGELVSRSELKYISRSRLTLSADHRDMRTSSMSSASVNVSSAYKFENSEEIATSLRTRKKKKSHLIHRKIIADLTDDTTQSSHESSRASTPPLDLPNVEETRRQMELAREHQKEYWLHSLNKQHNSNLLDISNETEDDIYLNEKDTALDSGEKERLTQTKADVHETKTSDEDATLNTMLTASESDTMTENGVRFVGVEESSGESDHGREEQLEKIFKTRKDNDLWRTMSEQLTSAEDHDDDISDPFIAMLPNSDNKQLIITVGKRFIHEKNIECMPMDILDLSCLLSATTSEQKVVTANTVVSVKMPVVHLTFDYVKRDRRERHYVMEDQENLNRFLELIQPALDARSLSETLKDRQQCFKCSRVFDKSEASVRVLEMSLSTHGKSSSLPRKYKGLKGDLQEQSICPYCKSSMVVAVDDDLVSKAKSSNSNSPLGSLSSSSSLTPLATSSAVNTPVKKEENREEQHRSVLKPFEARVKAAYDTLSQDSSDDQVQRDSYRRRSPAFVGVKEFRHSRNLSDSDISLVDSPSQTNVQKSVKDHIDGSHDAREDISQSSSVEVSLKIESSSDDPQRSNSATPSLTTSTCSDMVRSVYENSMSTSGSSHSLIGSSGEQVSTHRPLCRTDFHSVLESDQSGVDGHDLVSATVPFKSQVLFSIGTPVDEKPVVDVDEVSFKSVEQSSFIPLLESSSEFHEVKEGSAVLNSYLQETIKKLATEELKNFNSATEVQTQISMEDEPGKLRFNYDNFNDVDHRLKLHLVMNLFDEEEDVQLLLKCGVVQYMQPDEFVGILVVSTSKIYVLKIIGQESDMNLDQWIKCIDILPITDLQFIDIGYHQQSFRLEFNLEFSCYSFIVRDSRRCKKFINGLTSIVRNLAFQSDSNLQGIHQTNDQTLINLQTQVLHTPLDGSTVGDVDTKILSFCMGYLKTSEVNKEGKPLLTPISIIVTPTDVCLANENHQWPLPRLQVAPSGDILRTQFELKDRQKVSNIAQLETFPDNQLQVAVNFFNEDSSEDFTWTLTFTTLNSKLCFIDSLKEPWEALFGVDLTVL